MGGWLGQGCFRWGLKLNKIYRTVWNDALHCWVAVAETARVKGKSGSARTGTVAAAVFVAAFVAAPASAADMHGIPDAPAAGIMSQLLQPAANNAVSAAPVLNQVSQTAAAMAGLTDLVVPVLEPATTPQPLTEAPKALANTLAVVPLTSTANTPTLAPLASLPVLGPVLAPAAAPAPMAAVSGSVPPPLNPAPPSGLVIGTAGVLGGVGQGLAPLTMSVFGQEQAWLRSGALSVNRENINARFSVVNVLGVPILDLAPVTGTLGGVLGGPLPEQRLTLLGGVTSGNYITNMNTGLTYNNGLLLPGDAPSWVDKNNCLNVLGLAGATCWDIPAAQNNQVLIGDGASANGSQEVVIGTGAQHILPNENAGDIFTDPNKLGVPDANYAARKGHSVVIGDSAFGNANGQTILGAGASSTAAGGVALGFQSVADRVASGVEAYSKVALPTMGAVSVGAPGKERQITNVAGGTMDTDAVNLRQLRALEADIGTVDTNSVKYDDASKTRVTLAGAGGTRITNVKAGDISDTSTDAVNGSQLFETNQNVTTISSRITDIDINGTKYFRANSTLAQSSATGTESIAAGGDAKSSATDAVAIGRAANAAHENSIALGAASATAVGAQTDYVAYALTAPQTSVGEVSVGSAGAERKLTNVAAGSADTDAANIAQLKAVNTQVGEIDKLAVKYDDASKNLITLNSGGTSTRITNLAAGAITSSSTDAINGGQLWGWTQDETNVMSNISLYKRIQNVSDNGVKYFHANSTAADSQATGAESVAIGPQAVSGGANSVAAGNGAVTSADNSVALGGAAAASGTGASAVGAGAAATGSNATAMGSGSTASGAKSTAVGAGSQATADNSVALGADSVADRANTVSVGSAGNERQITNVADGVEDTDAANVRQLKAVSGEVTNIRNDVTKIEGDVTNIQEGKDGMFQVENVAGRDKPKATGTDSAAGGAGAVASGASATAVGNAATASGEKATALGNSSVASGANSIAVGQGTQAIAAGGVAMGNNSRVEIGGANGVALGNGSVVSGSEGVALGNGANVSGTHSMALGSGANAVASNSVALGQGSLADRAGTVSVGAAGQERQITNVADGREGTDAVNVRQLNAITGDVSNVRNELRNVERNAYAGAASAMAVAGLPQAYTPGRSMASAAASHYLGQSAIALGVSTVSENGRWVYKFAGNVNSQGKLGAVIGAGYQW